MSLTVVAGGAVPVRRVRRREPVEVVAHIAFDLVGVAPVDPLGDVPPGLIPVVDPGNVFGRVAPGS